jgi:threonine dehydrogenase-like Zn-dependent dehydrogenase
MSMCVLHVSFDVAGEVVAVGPLATRFKAGDRVFGMLDFRRRGGLAQYVAVQEGILARIPGQCSIYHHLLASSPPPPSRFAFIIFLSFWMQTTSTTCRRRRCLSWA